MHYIDYRSSQARSLIHQSLMSTGFCVLKHHPIDMSHISQMHDKWDAFFKCSVKEPYRYDPESQAGYSPIDQAEKAQGAKEYYQVFQNTIPTIPNYLQKITREHFTRMDMIASNILRFLSEHTPQGVKDKLYMPLHDMIVNSDQTMLRILHYPPIQPTEWKTIGNDPSCRAAAHTDINLLTILPASNEPGLQLKDPFGEWIDVPYDPSYLIVNVGDSLSECTGGYYPSAEHRVITPPIQTGHRSRYSFFESAIGRAWRTIE
ncbi:MAG: isopenicillin N synthase family oxygenase [Gammaproteobacteria bacterium AqS3]|nr:isopenicillin N synthase family oxygenase [Gammaproteobacteria bacterium AqS3]